MPYTDSAAPRRTKLLREIELPYVRKSKTDRLEPRTEMP
jgi:hypothetical protein